MLKQAVKGYALALYAALTARATQCVPQPVYRGPTRERKSLGNRKAPGEGTLTCRHGAPLHSRETMMRLRAMENGASVEIVRNAKGRIVDRKVVWPKTV